MKALTFNRYEFVYKVREYDAGEYGATAKETIFYDKKPKVETIQRRKYYLFGPMITVTKEKYTELFTLNFDIESPKYSREKVREVLYDELDILKRKAEIKKGQIV